MRNRFLLAVLLTALYLPISLLDYAHFPYSDGPEHGAAVRELAKHPLHPADPMLAHHPGNSPRFVPSILIMARALRLTGLDVLTILKLCLPLCFILFLVAVACFATAYFDDADQAPWTLASLLFLWGTGWTGANAYMFSALLYTAYFPSLVAFSLSLLALYAQLRFLKEQKGQWYLIQVLLGSLAFINHPPTGIFYFICSALLYWERGVVLATAGRHLLLAAMIALLATLLWPYYNFLTSVVKVAGGSMAAAADYNLSRHYLYAKPFVRSGLALAGVPFIVLFARRRQYHLLVGGCLVFCAVYLLGFVFKINLAERFIFFIIFTLQLALSRSRRVWFPLPWARRSPGFRADTPWLLLILLLAGIALQGTLVYREFIQPAVAFAPQQGFLRYASPNWMQRELGRYLRDGNVVLSDLYTSWSIPVYTGAKIIALYHSAPHVRDNRQRVQALDTFFNPASGNEERKRILKQYGVTHVLLNYKIGGKEIEPAIKQLGLPLTMSNQCMAIFSVPPTLDDCQ